MRGSLDPTESNATAGRLLGPEDVHECVWLNWAGFGASVDDPTVNDYDLNRWPCCFALGAVEDDAPDAGLVIAAPVGPALTREVLVASVMGISKGCRVTILGIDQAVVNRGVRQILEVLEAGGTA
jgi:hypothetical protein